MSPRGGKAARIEEDGEMVCLRVIGFTLACAVGIVVACYTPAWPQQQYPSDAAIQQQVEQAERADA